MPTGRGRYGPVMLRALRQMLRDFLEHGGPKQENYVGILHTLFLLPETTFPMLYLSFDFNQHKFETQQNSDYSIIPVAAKYSSLTNKTTQLKQPQHPAHM